MQLNREQLDKIEYYSGLFFTYQEIAIGLKLDIDDFIDEVTEEGTEAFNSYQCGKINSEAAIREQMVSMAKMGSPAAQQEVMKLSVNQKINESNA